MTACGTLRRMAGDDGADQVRKQLVLEVSNQLTAVRRRGIDDLELPVRGKIVESPELNGLAASYCRVKAPSLRGRRPQIRALLEAGLDAYAEGGNEKESGFIRGLFFDPDADRMDAQQAKILLDSTKETHRLEAVARMRRRVESGQIEQEPDYNPKTFDDHRLITFRVFSRFLVEWVDEQVSLPTA